MRLQLVSLLCLLLALAIAATDYKEPEDREVYNAEREALKLQILDQAVKATAYAAVGVYALYATIQDEMEPIKRAWDTLEADWNGRIHNSRNYMWASQYGSGTEVMKITFEYESRVRGSKIWEKRIESHFFTVTPAFQFNSFGLEYKDTVRYVQVADNAAAMGFVKEAGYYPGTVKAFSATCEPDGEILLAKVMGNFLRDASRDDRLISDHTSLPELVLRQMLKHKTTDFEVIRTETCMGSKGKHKSRSPDTQSGNYWPNMEERRNMFATGQITGSHTYIYRHWLFVVGASDSRKGYDSSRWFASR